MSCRELLQDPRNRNRFEESATATVESVVDAIEPNLEQAIELRAAQAGVLQALDTPQWTPQRTPQWHSAHAVADQANSIVNPEVDRLSGGVGNAFAPRLFAQSIIAQRARELSGTLEQTAYTELPEASPAAPVVNTAEPVGRGEGLASPQDSGSLLDGVITPQLEQTDDFSNLLGPRRFGETGILASVLEAILQPGMQEQPPTNAARSRSLVDLPSSFDVPRTKVGSNTKQSARCTVAHFLR